MSIVLSFKGGWTISMTCKDPAHQDHSRQRPPNSLENTVRSSFLSHSSNSRSRVDPLPRQQSKSVSTSFYTYEKCTLPVSFLPASRMATKDQFSRFCLRFVSALFRQVKKYDSPVWQSRNPALTEYLGRVLECIEEEMLKVLHILFFVLSRRTKFC